MLRPLLAWLGLIVVAAAIFVGGAALAEGGLPSDADWTGLFVVAALTRTGIAALTWPVWVWLGRSMSMPRPLWDIAAGALLGAGLAWITTDMSLRAVAADWPQALLTVLAFAAGGLAYALIASPGRAAVAGGRDRD